MQGLRKPSILGHLVKPEVENMMSNDGCLKELPLLQFALKGFQISSFPSCHLLIPLAVGLCNAAVLQ